MPCSTKSEASNWYSRDSRALCVRVGSVETGTPRCRRGNRTKLALKVGVFVLDSYTHTAVVREHMMLCV